jgi:V/A-type H+-transporting ATPase subunit I
MFRTVPAHWFEELIAKPMLVRAVEVLAETGEVEFEFLESDDPTLELSDLRGALEPYREVERGYRDYLPTPVAPHSVANEKLEESIKKNLSKLTTWQDAVAPVIKDIEVLSQKSWELRELIEFLDLLAPGDLNLAALKNAEPALTTRLFVLPGELETPEVAEKILHLRVDNEHATYLLVLGTSAACDEAEHALSGLDGRTVSMPDWLAGTLPEAVDEARSREETIATKLDAKREDLAQLSGEHDIAPVLGELRRLDWLVDHLEGVPVGEYFAHLTGWTSDLEGTRLRIALERASLPTILSMTSKAPKDHTPPTLIRNPAWIRPFEFFSGLMGTPANTEAEPSPLIAIIAPLLFGYMFGDIGHGVVIVTFGLLLRKKWEPAGMLISGGIASVFFGFMYGSVFSFEHLFPPLWTLPLDAPLLVLFVPLLLGGTLILLGMSLNGLGHFWEGRFSYWLRSEAGIMFAYVSLAASILDQQYVAGVLIGVVWHTLGAIWSNRDEGLGAFGSALGDLFEYALQLIVNTVSFVRVGAFALAHAGLGATVFSLADSAENVFSAALILLLGNIVIIALEGLVVSVQTTRLLLFEFFIRFMKAGGRRFNPMLPPDYEQITQA